MQLMQACVYSIIDVASDGIVGILSILLYCITELALNG